jgi:hypothetical protein
MDAETQLESLGCSLVGSGPKRPADPATAVKPVTLEDLLEELRAIRGYLAQGKLEVLAVGNRDLAKMLGVSCATLARWKAAELLLPGVKKCGRVLFPLNQVRRWVEAGMPNAKTWKTMRQGA